MVVGVVGAGEHACPTSGKWRRSASWADYAGRGEGKATYVRGDIRRGLTHKFSSWKLPKTARSPPRNKVHAAASSKSLASTATTSASTSPSCGLADTCLAVRPSDISSGACVSVVASELQPDLSDDVRFTGSEVKIESAPCENAAAMDMGSVLETCDVENEQKIEKIEEFEVAEIVAVTGETDVKSKQNVKVLFASTAAHMFALQLTLPASQSIGLKHFKGDFVAQAAKSSNLMAAALTVGVFVNPVIAGTTDVVGRKPVVISGLAISVLGKLLCAMQPNVTALGLQSVLMMPLANAHNLGVQTALGDLFSGDGAGFGAAQAQMMLAATLPGLVCPLIGASLTQKFGPAVPFAVAGIAEGSALLMDSKFLQETQPKEERKPLEVQRALMSANPLAFLELFRHGPRLSLLAVLRMVNFACDKSNLMQVLQVHRNETTGLTLQENARYMVLAFFVASSGFSIAGPLLQKFGPSTCLQVGLCTRVVESLIVSNAASLSTWKAALPLGVTGAAASTSVSAMLQNEATRVKLNQGQFQGCLSSLNSVTQVVMTLLWARLYAFGARQGRSGMYLRVVAVLCGFQFLLERILSKAVTGHQNAVTSQA